MSQGVASSVLRRRWVGHRPKPLISLYPKNLSRMALAVFAFAGAISESILVSYNRGSQNIGASDRTKRPMGRYPIVKAILTGKKFRMPGHGARGPEIGRKESTTFTVRRLDEM